VSLRYIGGQKAFIMAEVGPMEGADLRSVRIADKACKPDSVDLVIFHAPCSDGFAAAHAAWLRLGSRAKYIGVSHERSASAALPDVTGRTVAILDFSFDGTTMARMVDEAEGLIVLDHHASAEESLATLPAANKVFEMKQSGVTLSWNFFHPGAPVPLMYRYIEDRDIWRWQMRQAKEWCAAYDLQVFASIPSPGEVSPADFAASPFHAAYELGEAGVRGMALAGVNVLAYQTSLVRSHCQAARPYRLRGSEDVGVVMVVNVSAPGLVSEIGNRLASQEGVAYSLMWSILDGSDGANLIKCSMRSTHPAEGSADVSLIARAHGGGGHRAAASFVERGGYSAFEAMLEPVPAECLVCDEDAASAGGDGRLKRKGAPDSKRGE
jgi:hypothetical protein